MISHVRVYLYVYHSSIEIGKYIPTSDYINIISVFMQQNWVGQLLIRLFTVYLVFAQVTRPD